jgi:hypothetical protein
MNAFTIWTAITNLFHDNQLQRAVFNKAEFRNLYQGDMSITVSCAKLKTLFDNLRNVGQPVSEPSQVVNMLHGLNLKYYHAISAITSRQLPHTFVSAHSHLWMEELFDMQRAVTITNHALFTRQRVAPPRAPTSTAPFGSKSSGGSGCDKNSNKNKNSSSSSGGAKSSSPAAPWYPTYNLWIGMVQAWPRLFCAPGSDVLGPRPGIPAYQAMYASPDQGSSSIFDTHALMAVLNNTVVAPHPNSEWYVDSGASSHMSGTLSPTLQSIHPYPYLSYPILR